MPTPCGRWPPAAWPAWGSTRGARRNGWPTTAPTGCSPPTPTAGGWPCSRSRGSTPRWPSPARCCRRAVAGHVPGWPHQQGARGGVAGAPRLQPVAGRVLRRRPRPPGRVHPHRPPRHGPGRRGDRLGPGRGHLRGGHAAGHVAQVRPARLRRRVLRAAVERLRGARHGRQPAHRGLGYGHRRQAALRRQARRVPRALRGVRVHPAARCGS